MLPFILAWFIIGSLLLFVKLGIKWYFDFLDYRDEKRKKQKN